VWGEGDAKSKSYSHVLAHLQIPKLICLATFEIKFDCFANPGLTLEVVNNKKRIVWRPGAIRSKVGTADMKFIKKLSKSFQKVVKKLSKSCQKVVNKLSKKCQKIVKKLSKFSKKLLHFVKTIF
jgi:hypothetical protein